MFYQRLIKLLLCAALSGCATSGQTTLLGTGIGSVIGGSIGVLFDSGPRARGRTQNVFTGATFGALLGSLGFFFLHGWFDDQGKEQSVINKTLEDKMPTRPAVGSLDQPTLSPAKVESRYIDDQVRGNTFVPGHLEFQITEPSQWRN